MKSARQSFVSRFTFHASRFTVHGSWERLFQHPAWARIVAQPGRMPEGQWKQRDLCGLNGQDDAKSSLSLVRRRATPVSRAAVATAFATRGTTSLSNTLGMM